ncbi:hypothetical protein E4U46_007245 [Claviceps purpurea]|nr:hypothetical protein E4U46_007245 [Claviceps purpurea]
MAGSLSEREIEGILEEAIEELTIQNVVLDSMRTESWPGIELERQELTDKIERLKDKIRRIRQGSWGRSDDAATLPGPSSNSNSTPRSPAIAGGSLSKMPTFQGDERGRGSPRAVRSGKRNLREDDSDSADGRVKSRRATPIRHDGPVARSSGLGYGTRSFLNEPSDMIDLTGSNRPWLRKTTSDHAINWPTWDSDAWSIQSEMGCDTPDFTWYIPASRTHCTKPKLFRQVLVRCTNLADLRTGGSPPPQSTCLATNFSKLQAIK